MTNISDKIKNALFNGRVNNGKFRRGLWTVDELNNAQVDNKPALPVGLGNITKLYYSDGCIAFVITSDKKVILNTDNRASDTTMQIYTLFLGIPGAQGAKASMGGAHKAGGASRDWAQVFTL